MEYSILSAGMWAASVCVVTSRWGLRLAAYRQNCNVGSSYAPAPRRRRASAASCDLHIHAARGDARQDAGAAERVATTEQQG